MARIGGDVKAVHDKFLDGVSTGAITLAPHLHVDAPLDGFFDLFESIYADAIPPASNGNKDAALLHDDDVLEADTANKGIWLGGGRGYEGEDIQTLGVAKEEVVRGEEGTAGGRGAEVGWAEVGGDDGEGQTKLLESWWW